MMGNFHWFELFAQHENKKALMQYASNQWWTVRLDLQNVFDFFLLFFFFFFFFFFFVLFCFVL